MRLHNLRRDHFSESIPKVLRFLAAVRAPHGLQRPLMGKRLPLLNDESAQDVEIFRGQTDSLTVNPTLGPAKSGHASWY